MVRVKSRYLLCEIHVSDQSKRLLIDDRAISAAVKEAVTRTHGDYGAAQCAIGFSVKYVNALTGVLFLRCPKSSYQLIWSALPFITCVGRTPCFITCLHVGGTIRTCQKFLVRYNTQQLHRMLPKCKTKEEQYEVRRAILDSSSYLLKEKKE